MELLNPGDFDLNRDLVKTLRRLLLRMVIVTCELEKERDEAQSKLKEYQEASKS